jgi:hypothetical protein
MDSDTPHDGQPQTSRPYVSVRQRDLEQWRARIEREITARMPFANEALEAYYTDRRWNGDGLYAHYADLAFKELREKYLRDEQLVAYRNGLLPLERTAEGLHVRVRPGTTGIPDHLHGCPITVEYLDLPSQADVAAVAGEVTAAIDRLRTDQPGCICAWSMDNGYVGMAAWAAPVAEELHRRFGNLVQLSVGALRYPPSDQPSIAPRPWPGELIPDEVRVELDGPAVVRSGDTLTHDLLVHNPTGRDVWLAYGNRNAVVVDPASGEVVGGYAGAVTLPLHIRWVPPEQTGRVSLLIGTASFTPRLGYVLPPGEWGVQAKLRVIPDTRGPDRPMFTPPPDSSQEAMPVPPDTRGPDQRTPTLPLTITI